MINKKPGAWPGFQHFVATIRKTAQRAKIFLVYLKCRPHAAGADSPGELGVNSVLQALACGELWNVASRNIDFCTRGWVTALGGFATAYGKAAEACETDVATSLQFALDGFEYCVDGRSGISLGETSLFGNCRNELVLVHVSTPFNGMKRLKLDRRRILIYSRTATQKRWNGLKNKGSSVLFTKKAGITASLSTILC